MTPPAPVPGTDPAATARPASAPLARPTLRVTPAWWVGPHAFAVLVARLAYPLALLGSVTWLITLIIRSGASAWFILAVILVAILALAAAPKDPDASA